MRVRIERIEYNTPDRRDHLVKVPRRALYVSDLDGPVIFDEAEAVHKVESSGIVCDGCGSPIPYPYVWVLVIGGWPSGVQCEKCRERYHKDKPAYVIHRPL